MMRRYCGGRVEVIVPEPLHVSPVVVAGAILILVSLVAFEIEPDLPAWCMIPFIVGVVVLVGRLLAREEHKEE